jgi:hypothetical protein
MPPPPKASSHSGRVDPSKSHAFLPYAHAAVEPRADDYLSGCWTTDGVRRESGQPDVCTSAQNLHSVRHA